MTKIRHATEWWAGGRPPAQHCQQEARVQCDFFKSAERRTESEATMIESES